MAESETLLSDLYASFEARIKTATIVASAPTISILRKDTGSPEDLVAQATAAAGAAGVAIFITRPALAPSGSTRTLYGGTFLVEIVEEPALNRGPGGTGKTVGAVEDDLVPHLTSWSHGLGIGPLYLREWRVPEEGAGLVRQLTFGFGLLSE